MTQNIIQMNTKPTKNLNIDIKMEKDKDEKMHIDQNNGKKVNRKKRRRRKRKEKKSKQDTNQRFIVKKWSAVALWCYGNFLFPFFSKYI
ncbi:e3 ubiquitin-protein ligase rbx1 [Anaeramoeba flamelloides]|uniref:E3 ubiquitin-protein ligase rbx1 n=1 Tax=Anaeramoeba flamelloides TaxID=1746091 RepID=A0ABQ8YED8_9EUKA|nr:e3 ubiquitin-protein ligase rbx1 [Anaeramoeba flamelloides]